MKFFTSEKLGPKMEKTPEGFLLCRDVPIARTGIQLYAGGELEGVVPGPDGIIYVEREESEVFRPETIASFNGKPLVNDHPTGDVTPDNWSKLTVGVVLDPRRGSGADNNLLIADVLVTQEEAISDVLEGKREVSCGYAAQYFQSEPGKAFQRNILGNHVALVEKARCGAICSIADEKQGVTEMAKSAFEKILCTLGISQDDSKAKLALASLNPQARAVLTADAEGAELAGTHLHVHTGGTPVEAGDKWRDEFGKKLEEHEKTIGDMRKSHDEFTAKYAADNKTIMDALGEIKGKFPKEESDDEGKEVEGALEEEAPVGTGDAAKKAKDSAYLRESHQETVALAEIIAPGISVPTFDASKPPAQGYKSICDLRKRALQFGNRDAATNAMILQVRGGRDLSDEGIQKMHCSETRTLFLAVGGLKKAANNTSDRRVTAPGGTVHTPPKGLNQTHREYWDKRK
jgi:uncharacterized protein